MTPLSALRAAFPPDLRSVGGAQAATGVSKAISPQELASLTKAVQGGELGGVGTTITPPGAATGQAGASSFTSVLGQMVGEVGAKQASANQAVSGLLSGGNVSLHQAMISMEEANVSFQLMIEVRNKLLDSYQELMRMQV